ncbi:similar to An07g04010 [Aspergillus luchuensis]|uniref:Similar to An07g04010 n=1 Tax=Aspergillus kawachii TaxID=1069201 RepID=A0A146FFP6_ASPKA|nr:similar to An07g04010 [Aspergillus luchuensis]
MWGTVPVAFRQLIIPVPTYTKNVSTIRAHIKAIARIPHGAIIAFSNLKTPSIRVLSPQHANSPTNRF